MSLIYRIPYPAILPLNKAFNSVTVVPIIEIQLFESFTFRGIILPLELILVAVLLNSALYVMSSKHSIITLLFKVHLMAYSGLMRKFLTSCEAINFGLFLRSGRRPSIINLYLFVPGLLLFWIVVGIDWLIGAESSMLTTVCILC